jgi:hypothetical protein
VLYVVEDALHLVRTRLEGLFRAAGVTLTDLRSRNATQPTWPRDRITMAWREHESRPPKRQSRSATVAVHQFRDLEASP